MSQAELFALLSSDELFYEDDDVVCANKARFGWDEDSEFHEYEETLELAEALATMEW